MTPETEKAPGLELGLADSSLIGAELKRLAKQSSHYLAGLLGGLALGLVSFPIFTRVFSIAEYGLIDLAQKVLVMLAAVSKLGLQYAALRFYDGRRFAADAGSAQGYYSTMFFGVLSTGTGSALLFLIVVTIAPQSWFGPLVKVIPFLCAVVLLRALGSMLWAFLRVQERTKTFNALSVAVKAATTVAVFALFPLAGRTAQTYFGAVTLVEMALIVGLTVTLVRSGLLVPSRFDFTFFRAGVAFGVPLVVYEFAFAMLASVDRFLVRHYLGGDALGLYSVAYGLAQHANELLVMPLGMAVMPIYMRLWICEGRRPTIDFLSACLDLFLLAAAVVLAGAVAVSHDLVIVLASAKYAGAERLIPVLLTGLLIHATYVFLAAGLLIHNRTLKMAGILLVAVAFNIALNWALLPRMGLMGGALATLLSYSLCVASLGWASNRLLPLRINVRSLLVYIAAATMAGFAATRLQLDPPAVNLAAGSVLVCAVYGGSLYLLDRRVRRAVLWALVRCRGWF